MHKLIYGNCNKETWILIIVNFFSSRNLEIINKLVVEIILRLLSKAPLFNNEIIELIYRYEAITAYNAS